MKKVVIITAQSIRHKAFKYFISQQKGIKVLETIIEQGNIKLNNIVKKIDLGTLNKEQISERLGKELTDKIMKQKQNFLTL